MRRRLGRSTSQSTRGLTLLELVVAVLVLAIGSLAVLKAIDQSRLALGGAQPRLLAQIAAANRAQALRLQALAQRDTAMQALPDVVVMGPYQVQLSQHSQSTASGVVRVTVQARIPGAPGAMLVTYLPPGGGP